jgi:hypothetical protein
MSFQEEVDPLLEQMLEIYRLREQVGLDADDDVFERLSVLLKVENLTGCWVQKRKTLGKPSIFWKNQLKTSARLICAFSRGLDHGDRHWVGKCPASGDRCMNPAHVKPFGRDGSPWLKHQDRATPTAS